MATDTEELVTFSPVPNTFIICSKTSLGAEEVEIATDTPQTPNCVVWSPANSTTTETENTDGIQDLSFLNARFTMMEAVVNF